MKGEAAPESTAKLGLRNIGLIAYFICTVIGFCYATAYYSSFGVNILNHVAPLDLLFISFSHLGEIASTPIVIILEIFAVALVLLAICFIAVLLAFSWTALVAILLFPIPIFAGILAAVIQLFYWLKMAIPSIPKSRVTSGPGGIVTAYHQGKASTQVALGGLREFVRSALNTYFGALRVAPRVVLLVSHRCWIGIQIWGNWLRTNYLYKREDGHCSGVRFADRRWRFRSWYELRLGQKILLCGLVLLLLVQAPVFTGRLDAHTILHDCTLSTGFGCYVKRSRLVRLLVPSAKADAVKVYAIPSGNLASLGLSTCAPVDNVKNDSAMAVRKYATPNFRHDAGTDTRRGVPACLVYLGATSSTHFLADLGDSYVFERRGVYATREVGSSFRDCLDCPDMVVIPTGSYWMGSKGRSSYERPVHRVTIEVPFAVGKYEVTYAQWDLCARERACPEGEGIADDRGWGRGQRPVNNVSWRDAQRYVQWLSLKAGMKYRLLSESEWEYVARAGTRTAYSWGDHIGVSQANCDGCGSRWDDQQTAPIGSFPANAWGLHDMHGNVYEWVEDCWNDSYAASPLDGAVWRTGNCAERVLRGGSWIDRPSAIQVSHRNWFASDNRNDMFGFRVARSLAP